MGRLLRFVDPDTGEEYDLDDGADKPSLTTGWWPTDVTVSWPDVREDVVARTAADGVDDYTEFTGSGAVSIEAVAYGRPDARPWSLVEQLQGWCHPRRRAWLHLQLNDWPEPRRILVRGQEVAAPKTARRPSVQAQFKTPDGLAEAIDESTATVFPLGVDAGGLFEPISEPVFVEPSGSAGGGSVFVAGNAPCWPLIDIYGPFAGPLTLEHVPTGRRLRFRDVLTVDDGHFLRLDMVAHTATIDGDATLSRLAAIDFAVADWWPLLPGSNEIALTVGSPGAGCNALLRWRPRWLP